MSCRRKKGQIAELAQQKWREVFKAELKRLLEKKGRKRGAPPDLLVVGMVFSPNSEENGSHFEGLKRYCESKGIDLSEYAKHHGTYQKPQRLEANTCRTTDYLFKLKKNY